MKKYLTIISSFLIIVIALVGSFLLKPKPSVNKITDGDTVKTSNKDIIRYIGFDAPEKGDRWFCTETEAIKAGFIKARE